MASYGLQTVPFIRCGLQVIYRVWAPKSQGEIKGGGQEIIVK